MRRPDPGKLMALQKWEVPRSLTELRGFLGFTNNSSAYVPEYALLASDLMHLLQVGKFEGRNGSKVPVKFSPKQHEYFMAIKERLLAGLRLFTVNPDRPFVLRVDASDRAVGAALEQFADDHPHVEHALERERHPVAFCSRKLTASQARGWSPREKETYAVILALLKWSSWIGLQPILVLTDHKALEHWATEVLDTPSGPAGRRAPWHFWGASLVPLLLRHLPDLRALRADLAVRDVQHYAGRVR